MGYKIDTKRKVQCPHCKKIYLSDWVGADYCTIDCEEAARYARVGTKCGRCGEKIHRQIVNAYGGEIELDLCGCEDSGEF